MPPKAATLEKETPAKSTPSIPHAKPMPEERQLPASVFQRYPENRVPDPDAVLEMTGSIREVGQLQPITARSIGRVADDHPEQFEIIFGETRWLACQKLHADFPVRCYVLDIDDKEAAKIHAIENFQRRDLDEIQEARSMQNMLSHGWTVEEVMNHLGRAKDHIYKRPRWLPHAEIPERAAQRAPGSRRNLPRVHRADQARQGMGGPPKGSHGGVPGCHHPPL